VSHSQRLTAGRTRAVFRLVREVCELGDDPVAWRQHALAELCRLTGGIQGDAAVVPVAADPHNMRPVVHASYGLDPPALRIHQTYLARGDLSPDPNTPVIMRRFGRPAALLRQELVDDRTWYAAQYFNEVRRAMRSDGLVVSLQPVMGGTMVDVVGLSHELGGRPFGPRERRVVRLFHAELAHVWETPPLNAPPDPWPGLSPRQRQLAELLAGSDGEKQIAARLGLSRHTVHNYITALYRRVGVAGRAELNARRRRARQFRPRLV
jgi:DNA-binding CsgD family transcriptional regulator